MGTAKRREKEREELKKLILEAAKELFIENGLEQTTMRNIADKIDYSVGTVYLYFEDKDAILFEINNSGFSLLKQYMVEAMSITEDPYLQLRNIARAYVKFALENRGLYDLMFIMTAPINYICKHHDGEWCEGQNTFDFLQMIVQRCLDNKSILKGDVKTLSVLYWSTVHGMSSLNIRGRLDVLEDTEIESVMRDVQEAFLNMIKR